MEIVDRSEHGILEFQVIDTGIGIKEEDKSKLFKLFGFLETTKQLNTKGIGLGLHICKIIVQEYGGSIQVESTWGKGSSFTFLICLEEILGPQSQLKRCLNPNPLQKNYNKILLIKRQDESEESNSQ